MTIRFAGEEDLERLLTIRMACLRAVNGLPDDDAFSEELIEASRAYFRKPLSVTVLALDGETPVGCATLCAMELMPTFDHPTGKRGHLMNVYTSAAYRCQGIGRRMVELLVEEARRRGMTEISLDATEAGRGLYRHLGFRESGEAMVLTL